MYKKSDTRTAPTGGDRRGHRRATGGCRVPRSAALWTAPTAPPRHGPRRARRREGAAVESIINLNIASSAAIRSDPCVLRHFSLASRARAGLSNGISIKHQYSIHNRSDQTFQPNDTTLLSTVTKRLHLAICHHWPTLSLSTCTNRISSGRQCHKRLLPI